MQRTKAREHPADFLVVARVVGARREVDLARAAAKVRHREAPATACRLGRERLRVVARRRAFEAMKENQQRRCAVVALPVDVDEVAVGRRPAGSLERRLRRRQKRGVDRLQVAAGQPPGCGIVFQCRVFGALSRGPAAGGSACAGAGEAWCTIMRQPAGVRR
jgi:hypothetical protein